MNIYIYLNTVRDVIDTFDRFTVDFVREHASTWLSNYS